VVIQSGYFYYRGCNPRATGLMQSRHNKYQAMLVAFPPDFSALLIFSAPRSWVARPLIHTGSLYFFVPPPAVRKLAAKLSAVMTSKSVAVAGVS
jgi:hypothetical protein